MAYGDPFPVVQAKSVVYKDWSVTDPVAEMRMENGFVDSRFTASRPRFDLIRDVYTVDEVDMNTIMKFLTGQRLRAIPFTYTNPIFGTGLVRLLAPRLPGTVWIQGNPVWYQVTLELEEMP